MERDLPTSKALLQGERVRQGLGGGQGGRGVAGGGDRGGWGTLPHPYLWDGQGEIAEDLKGGGAVATRLALQATLQLPHKQVWGRGGVSLGREGHPTGFGGSRGVTPTRQHSPTILLSSLSRYRFHIWLARSSSLWGKASGRAASPQPGPPPPPGPVSPSPQRLGVLHRGGAPSVREDAGGPAALAVDLHVQPVHEELEELLCILLAAAGWPRHAHRCPQPPRSCQGSPGRWGG